MKRSELLSRILIVVGVLIALSVPFAARWIGSRGVIEMHGRIAESGGWTPTVIQAKTGVPLHVRLTSDDVMHGFAIGQSDTPAVDVLPGQMTDVTLTFNQPGTYTYYCTRWCGINHWRMRGKIEVSGGEVLDEQPGTPPLYQALNLDIDAAHPAAALPVVIPEAIRGEQFSDQLPSEYLSSDYYRSHSPSQAYMELRDEPGLSELDDVDIWDLVAYIWQSNTNPQAVAEGQKLFAQNCAACHGEKGDGNGVFAPNVHALTGKSPAKLSDPVTMLGASPALLQGKILRGGMGTGMPAWGPILTDQQTWDILSYLYTFHFKEIGK